MMVFMAANFIEVSSAIICTHSLVLQYLSLLTSARHVRFKHTLGYGVGLQLGIAGPV